MDVNGSLFPGQALAMAPSRPKERDDEFIRFAATVLAERVRVHIGDDDFAETLEEIADDIESAMSCSAWDGYELARNLDSHGYNPDAGLVEILDDAGDLVRQAHTKAVRQWVAHYGLTLKLAIGQQVTVLNRGQSIAGTVAKLLPCTAQYAIHVPGLASASQPGVTHVGRIFNAEDVEAINDPGEWGWKQVA